MALIEEIGKFMGAGVTLSFVRSVPKVRRNI